MSYVIKTEYRILPEQSFKVIRKCATCDKKRIFYNSKRFRVNANGNKVDVWLIYSCEKCKHTLNLSIYERKNPHHINPTEYQNFLENDEGLAKEYGKSKSFFNHNKAEIDWDDLSYTIQPSNKELTYEGVETESKAKNNIFVTEGAVEPQSIKRILVINEYNLNLREDKIASEILQVSRSQLKRMIKKGKIMLTKEHGNFTIDIL